MARRRVQVLHHERPRSPPPPPPPPGKPITIAAIAGSIRHKSTHQGLIRAGPLKNAIDWASRAPNAWNDKPAAIMSAGFDLGGGRSQYHLRQIGVYLNLHFLNQPELFIRSFEPPPKFDADGDLVDEPTRQRLRDVLIAFRIWILRVKEGKIPQPSKL